ncbi:MAG TPA: right-handed parallel beta-helix repeat-containing protein [Acidimicrobiia bacterium]
MRNWLRTAGVLVAGLTLAATWGSGVAHADATVVVRDGQSIQAAIDHAHAGDTIVVEHGTYRENLEIHTDRIRLIAQDATLLPPATAHAGSLCFDPTDPTSLNGICITAANADLGNNSIGSGIGGVEVRGFTIKNFPGLGIVTFGGKETRIVGNRFVDNGEYGTAAFVSTGTRDEGNTAIGGPNSEAGFYFGDSPNADAEAEHNVSIGNLFGVFERDAFGLRVEHNDISRNCVGVVSLANAPGPAGNLTVVHNRIHDNTKYCPSDPNGDIPINLSGIGVAAVGATGTHVRDNWITGNRPSGPVPFSGGLVVITAPGQTPAVPSHNHMTDNVVRGNGPDIFWDGSGTDNRFGDNRCTTSVPSGLCS